MADGVVNLGAIRNTKPAPPQDTVIPGFNSQQPASYSPSANGNGERTLTAYQIASATKNTGQLTDQEVAQINSKPPHMRAQEALKEVAEALGVKPHELAEAMNKPMAKELAAKALGERGVEGVTPDQLGQAAKTMVKEHERGQTAAVESSYTLPPAAQGFVKAGGHGRG